MEGRRKVERLKNGMFDDLTVVQASKELRQHGWTLANMEYRLFGEGFPIVLDDGTTYTGRTLRWA